MYEYDIVRIEMGALKGKPKEDHHAIIHAHAREGWRLVQLFAPPSVGYGTATFMELYFEREIQA
ncbi:DUF4177 domain-containing protein [Saccharibacillus alkalitolerans]|uniref:DUF4177 domain-containing protein n=1 Tax=Saccharibacillus alkalitolerans TaxID=2705290 RepID=A0ABX0FD31_9BACL|nr:DUF4177 domain-containing protein [Saccharibacillus alkalitolerans]NGZ77336.1 DUF4177 domain-containing protein [Saccharibacillus alkalitolerans]